MEPVNLTIYIHNMILEKHKTHLKVYIVTKIPHFASFYSTINTDLLVATPGGILCGL